MAVCIVVAAGTWLAVIAGCEVVYREAGFSSEYQRNVLEVTTENRSTATVLGAQQLDLHRVRLAGAINETVSLRFSIDPGAESIADARLFVEPLRSSSMRMDPEAVRIFRMHRVTVDSFPGWHIRTILPEDRDPQPLDVLVPIDAPRGGLPSTLRSGEVYSFWADIEIPKGTFEGTYTSSIVLSSGDRTIGKIDIELTVWPFILPSQTDIPIVAELDHRALFRHHVRYQDRPVTLVTDDWRQSPMRGELDRLLQSTIRRLQSHRLTPILSQFTPPVTVGARGGVEIDWRPYDAVVETYLSGHAFADRVPSPLWPIPVQAVLSTPRAGAWLASPGRAGLLRQYLAECASHFAEKGWLKRSYTTVPGAADFNSESIGAVRDFVEVAHAADDRLTIVSRLWPQNMAPYGWTNYAWSDFSDGIDVWLPPAQFYDVAEMAAARSEGKRTWLKVDRPPYSGSIAACAPPPFTRVLTWQGEQIRAEALFLGIINRWPIGELNPTPDQCLRTDPNVLLYPGGPFGMTKPVESVRLKYLRQSAQDAAYRMLLRDNGLEHVASALTRALAAYAGTEAYGTHFADGMPIGFTADATMFDLARTIMANELIKRVWVGRTLSSEEEFAKTAVWRRFMAATKRVRVNLDGVRLRLTGPRTRWAADAECTFTIFNGTRVPVDGSMAFATPLPAPWTTLESERSVATIRPGGSKRVTLTLETTALPTEPGGVRSLPIEFTTARGIVHRSEARVSLITAVPFDGSVRIDGDLSDWPPGLANVASGFRLITGTPNDGQHVTTGRPRYKTHTFVRRDSEYLYVAINSEFDGRVAQPTARRNRVEYDDMIPVGEELVEVLIDPLNAGTRSPGDLYHIVVKPSGSYLVERGIRFDPPCGSRSPWPTDIVVSVRTFDDRWTVEMRIPLDSFEGLGTEHAIWGFNVTRYDASGQEFSTWSGATRNAYDPLSLGNLYLP